MERLASTPVDGWAAILNTPASSDQEVESAKVRERCGPLVVDSSASLMASALEAVGSHAPQVSFATLTGDLIVHDFACRYDAVLPGRSKLDHDAFLQKTMLYVIHSLHEALPGRPLYVALGNNDSLCGDYKLDRHDNLYRDLEDAVMEAAGVRSLKARHDFEENGSFSTMLPRPLQQTKIVILDDIAFSSRFRTCSGEQAPGITRAQSVWLGAQLDASRYARQKVWTIAHIPPGIDPRSTFYRSNGRNDVCATRKPVMFLSDDQLETTLALHSDVVRLSLFGHTHMDELRLLSGRGVPASQTVGVPVKMVPSISPVGGNRPAFVIATVSVATSEMMDYTVYAASDWTDRNTTWTPEYSFQKTYDVPSFAAASLDMLTRRLEEDESGSSEAAQHYIGYYTSLGLNVFGIGSVWPQYRCVLSKSSATEFLECACTAIQKH